MKQIAELAIIVPCYNEEAVLADTIATLTKLQEKLIKKNLIAETSKIVFVNDGSKDKTWQIIYYDTCMNDVMLRNFASSRNAWRY